MTSRASLLPGLLLTLTVALVAEQVHALPFAPLTLADGRHPIDTILLSIVIGLAIRNTVPLPKWLGPGIRYSVVSLLPFAIIWMGARLNFFDLLRVSGQALIIGVICVAAGLLLTVWLARRAKVAPKLGLLIAVGTAICGGTAIAVTAPVIEAEDSDTAFAVTAITVFGLGSILVFPIAGGALDLSQAEFGVWAGTAIHATPQVMAAGFAYGPEAGDVAVIVKLVRVLLLAPIVLIIGAWYAREKRKRQEAHVAKSTKWSELFPMFIFGFVGVAVLNTAHLLPGFTLHLEESLLWRAGDKHFAMATFATAVSAFLVNISMAGVGLGVHLKGLAKVGLKAFYVGLFATIVVAVVSLGLLKALL